AELVPYDTLTVYETEEPARELVAVYARDRWAEQILGSRISYGEGITGWAALNRRPVLTNEAHLDPRRKTVPGTPADEPEALVCTNRSGEPLAVAMLDLDEFKRVNDVHSHGTGDEVLVTFADLLRAELRLSDVVCRVGGEEFGVVMPSSDSAAALQALDRIHRRLAREPLAPVGPLSP